MEWSNGGPLGLIGKMQAQEKALVEGAHEILQEVVGQAERNQTDTIQSAVTKTGLERVASAKGQRSPGRVDTGQMINSTTATVNQEDGELVGTWGWKDPEDYYLDQDYGTKYIQAAHSLLTSFIVAKADFARRFRAMVNAGGKK